LRISTLKYSSRGETVLKYPQNLRLTGFDHATRASGFKGEVITDAARATGLGFLLTVSNPEKELGWTGGATLPGNKALVLPMIKPPLPCGKNFEFRVGCFAAKTEKNIRILTTS
jgi:hypothetical protein